LPEKGLGIKIFISELLGHIIAHTKPPPPSEAY